MAMSANRPLVLFATSELAGRWAHRAQALYLSLRSAVTNKAERGVDAPQRGRRPPQATGSRSFFFFFRQTPSAAGGEQAADHFARCD